MKSTATFVLITPLVLLLALNAQLTDAQSCAAEAQTRRNDCGGLVHPYPPGQGCWAQGKCGHHPKTTTSAPSSTASVSSSSASSAVPSSESPSESTTVGGASITTSAAGITTITTSEGVCTCSCDSSTVAASEETEANTEETEATVGVTEGETEETEGASEGVSSGVTSGASETTSGGGYIECPLTDALFNMSIIISEEYYEIWIEFIHTEIQINILADVSLTYEEQVVKCAYAIKHFFELHVEIQIELEYEMIGEWGFLIDFIYVAYQIEIEITQVIVTLDSSNNCPLFEALRNLTENDSEKAEACEDLIAEITVILQTSSWSYYQQQAQIYLKIQAFFEVHAEWKSFFYGCQIEGFGLFEYYVDVCFWYYEITIIDVVIGGDTSSCELLQALYEASQNTSYSVSVRNQFEALYSKCLAYFEVNVDISVRLQYFVAQIYSQWQGSSGNYLEIEELKIVIGYWGSIYDLIWCSNICINCGCGNIDDGAGSTTGASTVSTVAGETEAETSASTAAVTSEETTVPSTAAVTSEETTVPSTAASTSTAAPTTTASTTAGTTTIKPANCATRWSMLTLYQFNVTAKATHFTEAILADQRSNSKWTASIKSSFNTYWNKINNAVRNTTASHQQIFTEVITACTQWNQNNVAIRQILWDVTIVEWNGNIGSFVGCGQTCGC